MSDEKIVFSMYSVHPLIKKNESGKRYGFPLIWWTFTPVDKKVKHK